MNIKWHVSEVPKGPYRSFHGRQWPTAFINDNPAFQIACADDYIPAHVRTGNHAELVLSVAKYEENGSWQWRRFVRRFATLAEAKVFAKNYVKNNPENYSHINKKKEVT